MDHNESGQWPDNMYSDYLYDNYMPQAGLTSSNLLKFQHMVASTETPRGIVGAPPQCIDIKGEAASDTSSVTAPDTTDQDDFNLVEAALAHIRSDQDIGKFVTLCNSPSAIIP